ncbi:phage Gp37/Gp68 family protein [Verminephrobacter aporrectodeae subsp. tuberculatae]|uniref:Phage Gp37/Gp68 family protein n=1 Tax=Verminephrobacter aporrectodeae subsp. tuberculatae TaxID=1110392 RepID=A0ABT3KMY5_9BURK|nr:phage Gp37/Gp68 family protein [Verminephrobacter aporrectodeae]MCW5319667.1 phage Gp37/Gp68 family protein [Verminephrobacter aporrectodeae subsp. tuberculatae]
MSANSKIEWTDHTFNPWEGCQKVGPGCDHCYAETRNARFGGGKAVNWGPDAPRRRTSASTWAQPERWNAQAEAFAKQHGRRQRVFCASLADVFDNVVPTAWRRDLFKLIARTPNLDWMLLTKRIGNLDRMSFVDDDLMFHMLCERVWLGITVCNQKEADRDIPKLQDAPARLRFLSLEPLLGPVDLTKALRTPHGPNWVIVGGESGTGARPMHPDWARRLRDQCQAAGVPFHFKQHGQWLATELRDGGRVGLRSYVSWLRADGSVATELRGELGGVGRRSYVCWLRLDGSGHDGSDGVDFVGGDKEIILVGKKAAGRILDGRVWSEVPNLKPSDSSKEPRRDSSAP